jgi:FkbM family methyltransferase
MSLGESIIQAIEKRRDRKIKNQAGAIGQFWRDGGNQLLFDLPVPTGSLIIDVGGYKGEWTAGMISRYGCKSEIFEPIPEFATHCVDFFKRNRLVQVHQTALGGSDRETTYYLLDSGTSEFKSGSSTQSIDARVSDVARVFNIDLEGQQVACLGLNIEGGEYEVLERMIEAEIIERCDCFLIQFHRQHEGYQDRYHKIVRELSRTHTQSWCYEMVWEKWVVKDHPGQAGSTHSSMSG